MNLQAPVVTSLRVVDPEMLISVIRDARLEACQLSSRPAPSSLARVLCPQVCLDFATLGPAMLFTGAMPKDCFTLVFVLVCPEKGHAFNFATEHTAGYMGFFPPGGEVDATTPAGYANATLTVPMADFHAGLSLHFPEIPDGLLEKGAGMRIGVVAQNRLRALLSAIEQTIWQQEDALHGAVARRQLGKELLASFFDALRSGCNDLVRPPTKRMAGRFQRMRRAQDYLIEHAHELPGPDDLCATIGLSARGLENLFNDFLGLSPAVYLRRQRLHGVRRNLQQASPAPGIIKQIALESGFWHLGRFASDYRGLFGETPSETLATSRRS